MRPPFCRPENQGGEGEQREGGVAMPPRPGADLVLVEADLALGELEAGLNQPSILPP
jgi:hypothetical protein